MSRLAARLILASRLADRGFWLFDRARSELVLACAGDETLDRLNDAAYSATPAYRPSAAGFRAWLFPWEEQAVADFFPAPPARVLVGGAGGGREALALAARGYEVVGFEPCVELVADIGRSTIGPIVTVLRARYEDMAPPADGPGGAAARRLSELGPYHAAIMGWVSVSHVRSASARLRAVQSMAAVTDGPVLVSYYPRQVDTAPTTRLQRWRRLLRGRRNLVPGDRFGIGIGYYHAFTADEFAALLDQAGVDVLRLTHDERDTNWPHAVVRRRD